MTITPSQQPVPELEAGFGTGQVWTSSSGHRATAWETPVFDLLWCDVVASDAELRRLWEDRRGRQAHLVILLATADDGSRLKVLGPQQARPVRELPREKIVDLLQQARSMAV